MFYALEKLSLAPIKLYSSRTSHQTAEEVGGGDHPLEAQLEGLAGVVDPVVVDIAPLGPAAVEVGVRVQLRPPVHDGGRHCAGDVYQIEHLTFSTIKMFSTQKNRCAQKQIYIDIVYVCMFKQWRFDLRDEKARYSIVFAADIAQTTSGHS